MDPRVYRAVRELYHELFPMPAEERRRRLAELQLDPEVRVEIEALFETETLEDLDDHRLGEIGRLLATEAPAPESATLPERIGAFLVLEQLGKGGMGVVYLAEQQEPVRRKVALKVIQAQLRGESAIARFQLERQALARLSHANVARLYEAGATEDGRPYFAMEYVDGTGLVEFCDDHLLTVEERLRLFLDVCAGVQHAHQKGVLHRDLKPSNLLVSMEFGKATPKVIDFGIAKVFRDPESNIGTHSGKIALGTPAYMSPEASAGREVDTRTDVYSLGVVLYELLAGVRPLSGDTPARDETTTSRPSTRLAELSDETAERIAKQRRLLPRALADRMRGDLDWIVMRAIEEDPDARYATVSELASDVERHFAHEPVLARPQTTYYLASRFVRRYRKSVAAAGAFALILVLGFVGTGIGLVEAREAERLAKLETARADREAEAARIAAEQAREAEGEAVASAQRATRENELAMRIAAFLIEIFEVSDPGSGRGSTVTARELLDGGANRVEAALADEPEIQGRMMHTLGFIYTKLGLYPRGRSLLEKARDRLEAVGDYETIEYSNLLRDLGDVYRRLGEVELAEDAYLGALEVSDSVAGVASLPAADAHVGLGQLYYQMARRDEAEQSMRAALEVYDANGVEAGASLGTCLATLAACVADRDLAEATPLFERSLAVRKKELPEGHPDIARARLNLGLTYIRLGRLDDARASLESAVEILEETLGGDHPDLATAYLALGEAEPDFEAAEGPYLKGIRILEAASPRNPSLAQAYVVFGTRCVGVGRIEEGQELLEKALVAWERVTGPESPSLSLVLNNLATVYEERGLLEDAIEVLERLVPMREAVGDPRLPDTVHGLGDLYRQVGRYEDAARTSWRALELRREALGPGAPATLSSTCAFAAAAVGAEQFEDALRASNEGLESPSPGDDVRGVLLACRGIALFELGRAEDARADLEEGVPLLVPDARWSALRKAATAVLEKL